MDELKKSVYIETTIPSVITARPGRDIGALYRQAVTREFWDNERHKYDLYISEYVVEECGKGDKDAARRRLELIEGLPYLPVGKEVDELAEKYFKYLKIPSRAKTDCYHLAVSVIGKMDFLMSWNLTHLGSVYFSTLCEFNATLGLEKTPNLFDPDALMRVTRRENEDI